MVLLNFRFRELVNGRISSTVPNPFQCGKYKVKYIFTTWYQYIDPTAYIGYWRIDSKELIDVKRSNGGYGFIFTTSYQTGVPSFEKIALSDDGFEIEVYLSSTTITLDISIATEPPFSPNSVPEGINFQNAVVVLDFIPI